MSTSAQEKSARFKNALQRFRMAIDRDSPTAKAFIEAYKTLRNVHVDSKNLRFGSPEHAAAMAPFFDNGHYSFGPSILHYMADAIDLYEKRKDAFQNQTASLFDPDCPHIKAIRHLIRVLKESSVAYSKGSPEYEATNTVEQALNEVQVNHYMPKTAKRDNATLRVSGYRSGGETTSFGKGVVFREYGAPCLNNFGRSIYLGNTIMEVSPDGMMAHSREYNALEDYIKTSNRFPLDITVIDRAGNAHRFNYNNPGRNIQRQRFNGVEEVIDRFTPSYPDTSDPAILQFCKETALGAHERPVLKTLSDAQLDFLEQYYLPRLSEQRPPLVEVNAKRAR